MTVFNYFCTERSEATSFWGNKIKGDDKKLQEYETACNEYTRKRVSLLFERDQEFFICGSGRKE